jgi:DNA primase
MGLEQTFLLAGIAPAARKGRWGLRAEEGSGALSREEIDSLKAGVRLEELAARYVPSLRRVGERWVGRCPFHDDKEPSFNIWPDSQSWYCFGACRRGGDVVDLLREAEGVDFRRALELLGGPPAGWVAGQAWQPPLPVSAGREGEGEPALDCEDRAILNAASEIYYRSLMGNVSMRRAIEARGISPATMQAFHLGYATGRRLARYLAWRQLDLGRARRLGLLHDARPSEEGGNGRRAGQDTWEHLSRRIVIPVMRGWETVYLIGRATGESQNPKYLGLALPKEPLTGKGRPQRSRGILVVEGPFDLLLLHEWGYGRQFELLALLGTQFKRRWLSHIGPRDRLLLATDQDEAGETTAAELADLFPGQTVRLRWPEEYEDVGDLARSPEGREIWARALDGP